MVNALWNQGGLGAADETVAAGDAADAALGAGEAALSFLARLCLAGLGETSALAAGDSEAAALSAGEAAFLECLCLAAGDASAPAAGDSAGAGDWAINEDNESPVNAIIRQVNLFMTENTSDDGTALTTLK